MRRTQRRIAMGPLDQPEGVNAVVLSSMNQVAHTRDVIGGLKSCLEQTMNRIEQSRRRLVASDSLIEELYLDLGQPSPANRQADDHA
jgi:hypothetical protein